MTRASHPISADRVRQLARRILQRAKSLPHTIRRWEQEAKHDRRINRLPDRVVLLEKVFPALGRTAALSADSKVLWIGCRLYTRRYYALLEQQGAVCWSIDFEPALQRWGRRGRHVTGDMLELAQLFPARYFDAVLCNGVFGWGVDTPADQLKAFEAVATVLKPGGWFLIGWDTKQKNDPLKSGFWDSWFEPAALPGLTARHSVSGPFGAHVYDTYRRLAET